MGFFYLNNSIECLIYLSMWFYNIYEVSFLKKKEKQISISFSAVYSVFSLTEIERKRVYPICFMFYFIGPLFWGLGQLAQEYTVW
jgi:glucose uptake protein GlcU